MGKIPWECECGAIAWVQAWGEYYQCDECGTVVHKDVIMEEGITRDLKKDFESPGHRCEICGSTIRDGECLCDNPRQDKPANLQGEE
jgi:hypothetical protein